MRVLLAEGDPALGAFLRRALETEKYVVDVTEDATKTEEYAARSDYDVLIFDSNVLSESNARVVKRMRLLKPQVLIFVLCAQAKPEDRVQMLDEGADDCLLKPFAFSELSARLRALLRRGRAADAVVRVGDLEVDRMARTVKRANRSITLTSKEFALLEYLSCNAGRQVTRSMIIESVWKLSFDTRTNVVDVYINYLRGGFEASLVSVEQLTYSEFLARLSELNYMGAIAIQPDDVQAGLQIDMPIVFPIIDLLLGGLGKAMPELRDLTEIEEQIIESVVTIILRELHFIWKTLLPVEFTLGNRLKQAQIQTFMMPAEKVLALSFEIRLTEARGMLNFVFPALISALLLRKLARQGTLHRRRSDAEGRAHIRERLMDCPFSVELVLPRIMTRIGEIVDLKPGQVLPLRHSIQEPMEISVADCALFSSMPVSCGPMRGGLVQELLPHPTRPDQEHS